MSIKDYEHDLIMKELMQIAFQNAVAVGVFHLLLGFVQPMILATIFGPTKMIVSERALSPYPCLPRSSASAYGPSPEACAAVSWAEWQRGSGGLLGDLRAHCCCRQTTAGRQQSPLAWVVHAASASTAQREARG